MRWKYFLATAGLFLCVFFSTPGFCSDQEPVDTAVPGGKPVAVVPEADYSFPMVVDGSQVVHDFILKNEGTAPLDVTKVKTG